MLAYFKSFKTFETWGKSTPQSWDVPIFTAYNDGGNVTIPKEEKKNYSGEWIYIAGHLFLIDESNPKDDVVELKVSDPANIFSRKLMYPENPESTFGAFIANRINSEFVHCSDPAYKIDYISVINEDATPFEEPELENDGLYSLLDVIQIARELGVILDFTVSGRTLVITIHTNNGTPHNIIFNDGHSEISDETFSRTKVAKITVLQETEEEGVYSETTWYLSAAGQISSTVPVERAEGDWEYLTIGKDDDPIIKAAEKFSENISSHKIEFFSDKVFNLWDALRVNIDGSIMETKIVSIIASSDTDRLLYKCGDLATTLTEKVNKKN